MEEYRQIEGFPNYMISNLGNVLNAKRDVLMTKYLKITGYLVVKLSKNGECFECKVHRLVATTFIDSPNNLPMVNHKDENKLNNHVNNLEWCDSIYNNNYGTRSIRQAEKMKVPIYQYSLSGDFIRRYNSVKEAGEYNNINPDNISCCLIGRSKTSKKYIWKYE